MENHAHRRYGVRQVYRLQQNCVLFVFDAVILADMAQVVDAYREEGFSMLLKAFNETDYLERLTGLDQLHKESESVMDDIDWEEGSEGSF